MQICTHTYIYKFTANILICMLMRVHKNIHTSIRTYTQRTWGRVAGACCTDRMVWRWWRRRRPRFWAPLLPAWITALCYEAQIKTRSFWTLASSALCFLGFCNLQKKHTFSDSVLVNSHSHLVTDKVTLMEYFIRARVGCAVTVWHTVVSLVWHGSQKINFRLKILWF